MSETSRTISHKATLHCSFPAALQHIPRAFTTLVSRASCVMEEETARGDTFPQTLTFQFQMLFPCPAAAEWSCSLRKIRSRRVHCGRWSVTFPTTAASYHFSYFTASVGFLLIVQRASRRLWMWFIASQIKVNRSIDWSFDWPIDMRVLASYSAGIKIDGDCAQTQNSMLLPEMPTGKKSTSGEGES